MSEFSPRGVLAIATIMVPTSTALPSVATLPIGAQVWVQSQACYYTVNASGAYSRGPSVPGFWTAQTTWFVSAAGTADATGLTSGTPVTYDEFFLRMGEAPVIPAGVAINVTLLTDEPGSSVCRRFKAVPGGLGSQILFTGTRTVLQSGTLTGVAARNPAAGGGGTPMVLTDAGAVFTGLSGNLLRISAGARAGTYCPITSVPSATTIRSPAGTTWTPATPLATIAESTPQVGDTYDIVAGTKIGAWILEASGVNNTIAVISLQDIEYAGAYNSTSTVFGSFQTALPNIFIGGCIFRAAHVAMVFGGSISLAGSSVRPLAHDTTTTTFPQTVNYYGSSYGAITIGGRTAFDIGSINQGGTYVVTVGGLAQFIDACGMDWAGGLVQIVSGAAELNTAVGAGKLYGSSATAGSFTVLVSRTATRFATTNAIGFGTLTAVGQKTGGADFTLGGQVAGPKYTVAAGFALVTSAYTLANLVAAGTFNNSAFDPFTGCCIAQTG